MTLKTFVTNIQVIAEHAGDMITAIEQMYQDRKDGPKEDLAILKETSKPIVEYRTETLNLLHMIERMLEYNQPESRKQYDELMAQFAKVHAAMNKVNRAYPDSVDENDYSKLFELESIASRVDPAENVTLEGAIMTTQMDVVKLATDPNYLGAMSDQKQKVLIEREEGKKVEGVFVKEHRLFEFDPHGVIEDILQNAVRKHPDDRVVNDFVAAVQKSPYSYSALLLCAMSKEQQKNVRKNQKAKERNGEKYNDIQVLGSFNATRMQEFGIIDAKNRNLQWDTLRSNKNVTELLKTVRGTVTEDEIHRMNEEFVQYGGDELQKSDAQTGSSKVGRNYAVSKIAMLLNASEVVPKTEPMKAEYGEQHIPGYFMQDVKGQPFGEEYVGGMIRAGYANMTADSFGTDAKKQLAKLQVIDYLCQNKNRSTSNLRVQVDGNFRVKGIVGVGNELTFPEYGMSDVLHHFNPVSLGSIIAIPEETAQIIRNLDPGMLLGVLEDTGLTSEERKGVALRLKSLKDSLESVAKNQQEKGEPASGVIRIYSDADWEKMSIDTLGCETFADENHRVENKSIFKKVNDIRLKIKSNQVVNGQQVQKKESADNRVITGKKADLFSDAEMQEHKATLGKYLKRITLTKRWYHLGSHRQFDAMMAGLQELEGMVPTEKMTVNACRDYAEKIAETEKKVKAYITYKAPKHDTGDVATKRLKEAKALAEYLKNFRESLYKAHDRKTSAGPDTEYKNMVRNRKIDRIANAIVRGAQAEANQQDAADSKEMRQAIQNTKKAEEAVRNTTVFKDMISDQKYGMTGKSNLNYWAEKAEKEPQALQEVFKNDLEREMQWKDINKDEKLKDAKEALGAKEQAEKEVLEAQKLKEAEAVKKSGQKVVG